MPLSTSCRVGFFSETGRPAYRVLRNSFLALAVLRNSEGIKRAGAVRNPGPLRSSP